MYIQLIKKTQSKSLKESKEFNKMTQLIQLLAKKNEGITLDSICKRLKISTPTGIKLVTEMQLKKLIEISGKKETENGRRPQLYILNKKSFYAVGIEILLKRISFTLLDIQHNQLKAIHNKEFKLSNTPECLNEVLNFIEENITKSEIKNNTLIGIGISITGSVHKKNGTTISYFDFLQVPFTKYLSEKLNISVFVDNDTHTIALAEKYLGKASKVENALVVNLSRGLGASIILNNQIIYGGNGFAGEFGHMQFNNSEKMCICGKRGCLGTFVSGYGLEEAFLEKISAGEKSTLEQNLNSAQNIRYDNIIQAALNGDSLSIQLIHELGYQLGKALGNLVNLLNPEKVILAGKFSILGNFLVSPVKMGLIATSLPHLLQSCEIEVSQINENAGLIGAGLQVFKHNNLI